MASLQYLTSAFSVGPLQNYSILRYAISASTSDPRLDHSDIDRAHKGRQRSVYSCGTDIQPSTTNTTGARRWSRWQRQISETDAITKRVFSADSISALPENKASRRWRSAINGPQKRRIPAVYAEWLHAPVTLNPLLRALRPVRASVFGEGAVGLAKNGNLYAHGSKNQMYSHIKIRQRPYWSHGKPPLTSVPD